MYTHHDTDSDSVSLHDCRAQSASFGNGVLSFDFGSGFLICPNHPENKTGGPVRTDFSRVEFVLESGDEADAAVYVFTQKKHGRALREEWTLTELVSRISSGRCELEFLYRYKDYNSLIIECCLWSDKKPYHKECEIKLRVSELRFCWNRIAEDDTD